MCRKRGSSSSLSTHSCCSSLSAKKNNSPFPSSVLHSVHFVHYSCSLPGHNSGRVPFSGSLYWEQHCPSSAAAGTAGIEVMVFMVPQTLCESASSSGRNIVVLFCVVIWCTFGPLHVAPANASRVTSGIVPSLFLASPQRGWHRQNVQGIHYCLAVCTNACVLRRIGSVPSVSPCPYYRDKDAITQSLATVARAPLPGFVQAKKSPSATNPPVLRWSTALALKLPG